jgi:hypothetical protein
MNTKGKGAEKAEPAAIKKHNKRKPTAILLAVLLPAILISAYFGYRVLNQPQNTTIPTYSHLRVAIVDQLSLTFPNQNFIETATNTLEQANCSVDYYPGEDVTVDFYEALPAHAYNLIILRVHAAGSSAMGSVELSLFTTESYNPFAHSAEQFRGEVGIVSYSMTSPKFFGISPDFVKNCMKQRFNETTIIMMGCDGLKGTQMAKAFIDKGARIYIAWNSSISADHTDTATEHLLQHLVLEKQTFTQAVDTTMSEVGPDEALESHLAYYPVDAGKRKIEDDVSAR